MADPAKVFDVEVADRLSQGCGRHASAACLCDVDVSLTADIEWTTGPIELAACESGAELAQRWTDWVFTNEIQQMAAETVTRSFGKNEGEWPRWPLGQLVDLDDEVITEAVERLRAGESCNSVARDMGLSEHNIKSLSRVLGTTRRNNPPVPYKLYACNRYADGAGPLQIANEVREMWGVTTRHENIHNIVKRAGVTRGSAA
jgi:hypothetical protein